MIHPALIKNMTANPRSSPRSRKAFNYKEKPIIVISFDDFFETDYTHAFPYMMKKGVVGTSYVNTTRMGSGNKGSWGQALEMLNNGWDLQCHTDNHQNITEITATELGESMLKVNQDFIDNGLEPPMHHAHPFGVFDASSRSVIDKYRLTQRRTNYNYDDTNYYNNFDFKLIKSINSDIQSTDGVKMKKIKDAIDYAVSQNSITTLFFHRITDEVEEGVSVAVAYEYFKEIVDYAVESDAEIMTIKEVYDYIKGYKTERGILN